jgi:hypothetical protein
MELLADRDPEEARKVLDPVLELMMEVRSLLSFPWTAVVAPVHANRFQLRMTLGTMSRSRLSSAPSSRLSGSVGPFPA